MPQTRRHFIASTSIGAVSALLSSTAHSQESRPNILFIMSDDHAVNSIGCYGKRLAGIAQTPNIDRIANEGMRLNNCFCTNSICVPSRASILTGKYSHKNGVYSLRDAIDPNQQNVAKLLRDGGYQTAVIGKWHLKTDPSGFDYWNVLPGQGKYHNPVLKEKDKGQKEFEGYSADVIGNLTLDWLKQRDEEKPFFLMCQFKAPHEPWGYAERYADYLKDTDIPEPDSLWEDKSHRSPGSEEYGFTIDTLVERFQWKNHQHEGPIEFSGLSDEEKRKKAYQIFVKFYLRACAGVDHNIGRLLEYMEENNLADNTVVIYTSDQGYFLGEHNYIDKRWMYEESMQMPFVVRYPKEIDAGSTNDDLVINVDFPSLFLDYAGLETPDDMQGKSFRSILRGDTPEDWRDAVYYRYWMHVNRPAHYGIRTKRFKLLFFYGLPLDITGTQEEPSKPGMELYDLKNDPNELNNVYDDPAYEDVVLKLKKELLALKEKYDDTDEEYSELMKLQREYFHEVMSEE